MTRNPKKKTRNPEKNKRNPKKELNWSPEEMTNMLKRRGRSKQLDNIKLSRMQRESAEADAYSVEATEVEALKELEGRLMNAIRDGLKEVNQYVESLGNLLTPIENEVRGLRMSVPEMSVRDAGVLDIAKQMPSQHGEGNDEEDSSSKDETWKKIVVQRMMTWKKRVVIRMMTWKKRVVPRMMTLKR
ncbi:unnamed protein product [Brassica oleracea]